MKKSRAAKNIINSLIPLGMIVGTAIGVIVSIFLKPSFLVFSVSLGAGIGYFVGVISYAIRSKKEN